MRPESLSEVSYARRKVIYRMANTERRTRLIGREAQLATAVSCIKADANVAVVGGRATGRTSFLTELKTRLQLHGFTVATVSGIASLRPYPLAAMSLAGFGSTSGARLQPSIAGSTAALEAIANRDNFALLVDDWDHLDSASRGVAEAAQRTCRFPVAVARPHNASLRHTRSEPAVSPISFRRVVEMRPLTLAELDRISFDRLGSQLDPATLRRIHVNSGGIVGLALNAIDAAVSENRLRLVDGTWIACGDLWSRALREIIERRLEALNTDDLDALHVLSLIVTTDLASVRQLISLDVIERLEGLGVIRISDPAGNQVVEVVPALILEYFRREPLVARGVRLTERIVQELGTGRLRDRHANLVEREGRPDEFSENSADAAAARTSLTARELEVTHLAAAGLSNKEIAGELVVSVRTVESHLHHVMRKTGSCSRGELRGLVR
jgi:DNA-binding CsgD family transcriptional regulator